MNWQSAEADYEDEVIGDDTLAQMFFGTVERHEHRPAQMYKGGVYDRSLTETVLPDAPDGDYHAISYAELGRIVQHLAAGFRELGVEPGDRVGIYGTTRMEWAQSDWALLTAGAVVTTVYAGSSRHQVQFLLEHPGATGVVVENETHLENVLAVEDALALEFVVVMDTYDGYEDREDVMTLAEVHDRGSDVYDPDLFEEMLDSRTPEDLASLIYTSGTTGQPKGVKLTHRNFRSNVNQCRKRYGPRPDKKTAGLPYIDETTRTVSFLPLAHVLERLGGHFLMFACGACVAYAESPDTLQEDFQAVRPSVGTSVPRVYEKIYDAIRSQAQESPIKERIFEWAVGVGQEYHKTDSPGVILELKQSLADRLVFSQVKAALGGNIDFFISGGGSLSPDLCALYHGMGLPIMEGYGLTETSPVIAVNPAENPQIGTVGPPLPENDVKLDTSVVGPDQFADVPGETGELLVAGPNVTDGYYELPEETAAAFTDDGYFRTGDIVTIRPDGYIKFQERAKQILVLSTGKNVAPGPIEDAFASSPVVEQCMVLGDGRKFISALVVPSTDGITSWAERGGVDVPHDPVARCRDDRVRERIQEEVDAVNATLEHHEQIKKFRLIPEEFTEENELLTPSLKKKRRNILDRFADEIDVMYDS